MCKFPNENTSFLVLAPLSSCTSRVPVSAQSTRTTLRLFRLHAFAMPSSPATDCARCGTVEAAATSSVIAVVITQCDTCTIRCKGAGRIQGICAPCLSDATEVTNKDDQGGFQCAPCAKFVVKEKQQIILKTIPPPDPAAILQTAAGHFPFIFVIAQASPEELV